MIWSFEEGDAKFDALLKACLEEGAQVVAQHGAETAVLVPIEEWRRLQSRAQPASNKPTLKELLLADEPRFDFDLPDRHRFRCRPVPDFE